jgi:purine nucleosidase
MKRVIFDTDIGIDDAMALLFLHYAPEVQLEAITTVSGNASIANTTRNACYVCERFAIDVPVFRGAASPVGAALGSEPPAFVHGSNGLGDISFEPPKKRVEATPAAEAIVKLAEAAPGELSVVAVGRLTNLARALDLCPRLPSLLKDVVVMGGVIGHRGCRGNVTPVAEANIAGDPIAADRVFGSGLALTLVGLDVTQETIMNEDFIDTLRATAGDAGEFIHDITRFYFDFYESLGAGRSCPIHDSSAVACLIAPELYATEPGPLRVACEGIAMGQTILGQHPERYLLRDWRNRPSCKVCVDVDAEAVRKLYLDTLAHAS